MEREAADVHSPESLTYLRGVSYYNLYCLLFFWFSLSGKPSNCLGSRICTKVQIEHDLKSLSHSPRIILPSFCMRTIVYCTTTRLLQLHEFNPFICSGQTPNRAHGGHVTRRALFQMDWLMSQLLLIFIVKFIPFFLCFSPILSYQYAMHSEIKWSKEVGWLPWIETSATLHHNFPQNFHKFLKLKFGI